MTSFFQELLDENVATHAAVLAHPTVRGIGDGTLPEQTFRYYIEQDYQFLLQYARVLAHAVAASNDLPTTSRLADLLHATVTGEIESLSRLYEWFGGERLSLARVQPSPTTQAYADHLLARSAAGSLLLILAAVLPCQWGYHEIGSALAERGRPGHPGYAGWIDEYVSPEYSALVDWLVTRFDELAVSEDRSTRQRARAAFALSSRYELAFWQMAWDREEWPGATTQ